MATWKRDSRLTALQRLGCAGLAGTTSLSVTAPLEALTVLSQVGSRHAAGRGLWRAGRSLCRAEGIGALWKGNLTACLRLFPYSALQLAAHRRFVLLFVDDVGHISQWSSIMAGSLAGMVAAVATYPTEVIKTRLIVQNRLEPSYKGILHALYMIYHQEGVLALYRGVSLSVLGAIPFSLGSFLVYTHLDKIWGEPSLRFTPLQNFINGCLAAGVAQTVSFPFETVKRKMQQTSWRCQKLEILYQKHFTHLFCNLRLTEGITSGLSPPRSYLRDDLYKPWGKPLLCNTYLFMSEGLLLLPPWHFCLACQSTVAQAQSPCLPQGGGVDISFAGMIDCFKQTVKTNGALALWSGLTANLLRIVPYFGVMFSTFEFCKRVCLYRNGYIDSPLSYKLTPGVDQSLQPQELQEFKLLGRRNF
ncbi:solute carrier family 25 member 43 isoform X1 [Hemicordylus capensis]|uniref:solute carrier family 25 member 43 isoform X1 n=1 Tax=Hemicordylus capensis TaxID=884348 RepID=UPI002303FAE4|nr:solute carrier family 25 member 43 isoform X1 [Hemicordylus capensis]